MSSRASRTVYVGNLPGDVREREVEDLFYKYGPIVDIDLKLPPRPPGFCFVEFEDPRDAEDAIRGRDGYNFDGQRLRVELAHGGRLSSSNRYNNNSNNNNNNNHGSHSGGRPGGVSRRTEYRVLVSGLPTSASWQDLKDHMRKAGDVCYAEVFRDGSGRVGVVDYTNYDDMKYAIKKLNESEFRNLFSRSYIRVKEDRGRSFRRSRSPSYSRSRSRSKGKSQSRSKSVSRSRSPSHSHSVSRSHSGSLRRRSYSRSVSRSKSRSQSPVVAKRKRSLSRSPSRSHSFSRSGSTPRPIKKKSTTAGAERGPRSPSVSPRSKSDV